jgi:hypothetical protein
MENGRGAGVFNGRDRGWAVGKNAKEINGRVVPRGGLLAAVHTGKG